MSRRWSILDQAPIVLLWAKFGETSMIQTTHQNTCQNIYGHGISQAASHCRQRYVVIPCSCSHCGEDWRRNSLQGRSLFWQKPPSKFWDIISVLGHSGFNQTGCCVPDHMLPWGLAPTSNINPFSHHSFPRSCSYLGSCKISVPTFSFLRKWWKSTGRERFSGRARVPCPTSCTTARR